MEQPISIQPPFIGGAAPGAPAPTTPAAAFVPVGPPVTPVAAQPILSLVPPIASPTPGEGVRHPDPIATHPAAPPQHPTAIDIPIAPVRPRNAVAQYDDLRDVRRPDGGTAHEGMDARHELRVEMPLDDVVRQRRRRLARTPRPARLW